MSVLPPELIRLRDEVTRRVRFMSDNPSAEPWDKGVLNSDVYSVVSILGWRGSGKTTVLKTACHSLQSDADKSYVVLPLIRPELFTGSQNVIASTLAGMISWLERTSSVTENQRISKKVVSIEGDTLELRGWGNRLLRYAAALGFPQTRISDSGLDEYIADSSKTSGAATEFQGLWSKFVEATLSAAKADRLIVPIDDADLASTGFSNVLQAIRWLANVERVTVLLAADFDEARRVLLMERRGDGPYEDKLNLKRIPQNSAQVAALRVVDGQLAKVLPAEGRVFIPEMEPLDCLYYKPVHEDVSLYEQMSLLRIESPIPTIKSLADLFGRKTDSGLSPTWNASALPSNPRELNSIYQVIKRASPTGNATALPLDIVGFLIELCLQHGIRKTGLPQFWPSDFWTQRTYFGGEVQYNLDLERLSSSPRYREISHYLRPYDGQSNTSERVNDTLDSTAGVISSGRDNRMDPSFLAREKEDDANDDGAAIGRISQSRSTSRTASSADLRLSLPGATLFRFDADSSKKRRRSDRWVDDSLSATFGLASEFRNVLLDRGNISLRGPEVNTRGGINFMFYVECSGTDNRFLLTPEWKASYNGWVFEKGWQRTIEALRANPFSHEMNSMAGVLDAWTFVLAIDKGSNFEDLQPHMSRSADGPRMEDLRYVVEGLSRRYSEHLRHPEGDINRFAEWYEELLPQALHPWLLSDSAIEQVWDQWLITVDRGSRSQRARNRLANLLSTRVKANLGESWIEPVIDLLGDVDSTSASELSRRHDDLIRMRSRAQSTTVGQAALRPYRQAGVATESRTRDLDDLRGGAQAGVNRSNLNAASVIDYVKSLGSADKDSGAR